jgi:FkbM family methyltransferase
VKMNNLKRLSYSPFLASIVRRLGLRDVARSMYAGFYGLPRTLTYSIDGLEGSFLARTPWELRCIEGTWFSERDMLQGVISSLKPGDAFLDAGSNLGMFTVFAAKAVGAAGTVLAFEPELTAYQRLLEHVYLNRLSNVRSFKKALSSSMGSSRLLLGPPDGVSQGSRVSASADGRFEPIELAAYDSLRVSELLPVPNVVKMDIEGHEFSALRGMKDCISNADCRAIFCEVHPPILPEGVTVEEILTLLRSAGFSGISAQKREEQLHIAGIKDFQRS